MNIGKIQVGRTWTEICCARGFVNLKDDFIKFREQVPKGVSCQGQQHFSPGGTHEGYFEILSNIGHFHDQIGPAQGKLQMLT